jgi:hypothetical protein
MPKASYRELRERFEACGISEIRSDDLELLQIASDPSQGKEE